MKFSDNFQEVCNCIQSRESSL